MKYQLSPSYTNHLNRKLWVNCLRFTFNSALFSLSKLQWIALVGSGSGPVGRAVASIKTEIRGSKPDIGKFYLPSTVLKIKKLQLNYIDRCTFNKHSITTLVDSFTLDVTRPRSYKEIFSVKLCYAHFYAFLLVAQKFQPIRVP